MVNEEILGGLVSALSRGESLEKAMFSFYNAGYGKNDIEEATRELYNQTGGSLGIKPETKTVSTPEQKNFIPLKVQKSVLEETSKPVKETQAQRVYYPQQIIPKQEVQKPGKIHEKHKKHRPVQVVSRYGQADETAEELKRKIETAIEDLREIKLPSKIEIINKRPESRAPVIIQKISDYGGGPPKPMNKAITLLLVFILILLLGALAAVFFFKDQLIDVFNQFSLG